ncbi:hypothetical protein Tco_0804241 [Tanacetum coccineum]|uniref:Reverse transcriptase domain-containing protein n=1 Tax=Tanacetum coccineum TaxID=301880 RepID=A0ABQ5A5G5_9ASTR
MRTRSQSRNLHHQQQQAPPAFVEPFNLEEPIENPAPPVVTMDDNRTMAQLLEAPTEGYEDAIVVPEITADNFELKHGLLTLVQNKQFFGHDKEDPHAHIRYFNKITSTMKFPNVPSTSVKLMRFPFSLEGAARIWLEKEPPRSIQTWDDLTFYEAWDRFNDLLRACPHHGFSELHQLDTFYNALNSNDQDSLNSATGGNVLDKMPRDCLRIIESKAKVRNSRNKPVVAKVSSSTSTLVIFPPFEEADSFLAIDDDPTSPEVDPIYYDPDGDILLLEANSLIDLPPHLEYAFLEGNDKLPVIIAKDLKNEEKAALIEVLKSHKRASLGNFADNKVKETGRRSSYPDFVEIKINSRQELMEIFLSKLWIVALRVDRPHGLQISYITSEDFIVKECHHSKKNKFFKRCQTLTSGTTPSVQNLCKSSALACVHAKKLSDILEASTIGPTGGHHCANSHRKKRTNTHLSGALRQAVYMKACHLPIELEHKAYWVLKHANFDLKTAGDQRKVQLNELSELRDQDYENSLIYKEKNKRKFMTQRFKNRVFT